MLETVLSAKAKESIKCKAFLLRVTAQVKNTRYLRVLSPDLGMIECLEKRRFAKLDDNKAYADFISAKKHYWPEYSYATCELFAYKNKYYLKDFTIVYNFQDLSKHILAYASSQLCNDLLYDLVTDREQAEKLWPFYLHTLYALKEQAALQTKAKTSEILALLSIFILRVLAESGYRPDLEAIFHKEVGKELGKDIDKVVGEGIDKKIGKDIDTEASKGAYKGGNTFYQFNFFEGKLALARSEKSLAGTENNLAEQALSAKFSTLLHYVLTCQASQIATISLSESLALKLYDFAKRWLVFSLDRSYDSEITLDKLLAEQAKYHNLVLALAKKRQNSDN